MDAGLLYTHKVSTVFTEPVVMKNAVVVHGAGRGRRMGIPTLNMELSSAPKDFQHGIYACWIMVDGKKLMGAMHYGLRPAFKDSETLEVHVIDALIDKAPDTVDLIVVARIRDVEDFPDAEALIRKINDDIKAVRGILTADEKAS